MATGMQTTSAWIKFFTDAGIPPSDAANYAIKFSDNRIQKDMLLDLNKEYLNDMGISMLGDVIAILKHAKSVHSQDARERALNEVPSADILTVKAKRSTAASRFVDRIIGSEPNAAPMNKTADPPQPVVSRQMAARLGTSPAAEVIKTTSKISLSQKNKDFVPVPKVRRVLPEHEGKYKVIMPSGTTAKTRKLLAQKMNKGMKEMKKSTVFERLGEDPPMNTKVTITGLGNLFVRSSSDSGNTDPSIFKRLGSTAVKRPATSTSDDLDDVEVDISRLRYAGVLKSPRKIAKAIVKTTTKKQTLQDRLGPEKPDVSTTSEGIMAGYRTNSPAVSAKNRLGKQLRTAPVSCTNKATLKLGKPGKGNDMRARLGRQKAAEVSSSGDITIKAGIFGRLGQQS